MLNKLLLTGTICCALSGFAQNIDGRKITETLCSPEFHGRGYVNGGDSIAAAFIAGQFERLGLKPLPGKTDYYQSFSFPVNTFPGKMELRFGGKALVPGQDFIVTPNSGSFTGSLEEIVTLNKKSLDDMDKVKLLFSELETAAQTKVVVVDPSEANDEEKKLLRLIAGGLSSVAPVIELSSSKFTWSVADDQEKFPHVMLRDSLFTQDVLIDMSIENQWIKNHVAKNVMAYVPAKRKRRKKYIFLTAHYDHLGRMGEATYFPGANDNASGTAIMLGLADAFKTKPMKKYHVVFIAFAGEEAGLLGSKYFVENPAVSLDRIRFVLNTDIMGSGEEGITVVNGSIFPEEFEKMVAINQEKNYLTQVKVRGKAANSDHYYFSESGVPAFFIYTMGPNKNYHDIFDLYENLSFAEFDDLTLFIQDFLRSF